MFRRRGGRKKKIIRGRGLAIPPCHTRCEGKGGEGRHGTAGVGRSAVADCFSWRGRLPPNGSHADAWPQLRADARGCSSRGSAICSQPRMRLVFVPVQKAAAADLRTGVSIPPASMRYCPCWWLEHFERKVVWKQQKNWP